MASSSSKAVALWLFIVCILVVGLVSVGGYVRLTRSGLSIVEWDVITGVVPPIGEDAWQATFAQYQESPEYQKINVGMTLQEYKTIFYLEYIHRLIARLAGLAVVLPLFYFLVTGAIRWRDSGLYLLIAVLFALQGAMGWYMVSSGLVDRPSVSHYRLTAHLLLALLLLTLAFWAGLNLTYGKATLQRRQLRSPSVLLAGGLIGILVLQIAYGGLVAGLKAGHISDTFPLMFGYLIPPGIMSILQPAWINLVAASATVQFIHRWLAFFVLAIALILYYVIRKRDTSPDIGLTLLAVIALVILQILLGISVIWFHVPLVLALLHQAVAMFLFLTAILLNHQLRRGRRSLDLA